MSVGSDAYMASIARGVDERGMMINQKDKLRKYRFCVIKSHLAVWRTLRVLTIFEYTRPQALHSVFGPEEEKKRGEWSDLNLLDRFPRTLTVGSLAPLGRALRPTKRAHHSGLSRSNSVARRPNPRCHTDICLAHCNHCRRHNRLFLICEFFHQLSSRTVDGRLRPEKDRCRRGDISQLHEKRGNLLRLKVFTVGQPV